MRKTKDGDDKTIKFYNVVNTTISVGLRPRTIPYQVIFMFTIQTGNIKVSMVRLNGKAANSAWRGRSCRCPRGNDEHVDNCLQPVAASREVGDDW